jgi:cytoskeletal protein RodZ
MINIKNILSRFKRNAKNKITNIKNGAQKFKENFSEAKSKSRSKRKSLFLSFTTVLGIFGVTLLALLLPAVAKNVSKNTAKPSEVCPSLTQQPAVVPSQQIISKLSGAAASICALAVSSGSFMIGAVSGVIVLVGILKAQGK